MDIRCIAAVAAALVAAGAVVYIICLRAAIAEVARELEEKLGTDTNTLISVSCGDRAVRALAAKINTQLAGLRRERLRLQNGDAELRAAVTDISHDLRTPLTAVCGYLDLLEEEEHSEKAKRYISVIRERTDAMRGMTEELLEYSVVSVTSDSLRRETASINDILEQSLAGFYGVFTSRGITPDICMPSAPVMRPVDRGAVRRIFDNILGNAAKYSDGDLCVRLEAGGRVTFSNSAAKLGAVDTERLFDRFYTVETASGSSGLGLSIARLLTKKLGGSITAGYSDGRLCVYVVFPDK